MKLTTKISAFTLSEMIVVIILTSIVMGLAFSVLSLVRKHMNDIKTNYNNSALVQRFESKLWLELNRYPIAKFNAAKNKLILSSDIDSTSYHFHKEFIVASPDTFHIQLEKFQMFFAGKPKEEGFVDAVKFTTSKTSGFQNIFIYKRNDANAFMN